MRLEEIIQASSESAAHRKVFNNAGQHWNHSFFWNCMRPSGGGKPEGALAEMVERDLGGFDRFRESFIAAGMDRFGSGWAWLVDAGGKLQVESTPNQDNPWMEGRKPILGIDVWEHAYYLKYQNRRADYCSAWWNVLNWDVVAARFSR